jgi:hypothetical protein
VIRIESPQVRCREAAGSRDRSRVLVTYSWGAVLRMRLKRSFRGCSGTTNVQGVDAALRSARGGAIIHNRIDTDPNLPLPLPLPLPETRKDCRFVQKRLLRRHACFLPLVQLVDPGSLGTGMGTGKGKFDPQPLRYCLDRLWYDDG